MIRVNSKAKMNLVHHGAEQLMTALSFITHRKLNEVDRKAKQFAFNQNGGTTCICEVCRANVLTGIHALCSSKCTSCEFVQIA